MVRRKVVADLQAGLKLTSFTPHADIPASEVTGRQDLTFFISPQADPFSLDTASGLYKGDSQPLVTIAMRVKTGNALEGQTTLDAQTTVASRTYAR